MTSSDKQSRYVWFDDGNVILRAQNTVFRVFKGILSRESLFFRGMFSLPQPAETTETYADTGCPVVEVHDEAAEMELFLTVVVDPEFFYERCDLDQHISLLSISSKYQATRILRRIMVIIEHFYPNTPAAYDHSTLHCNDDCPALSANRPILSTDNIHRLIQVAKKCDMLILLPAALLRLNAAPLDEMLADENYNDWPQADIMQFFAGLLKLDFTARRTVFIELYSSRRQLTRPCAGPGMCSSVRQRLVQEIEGTIPGTISPFWSLDAPGVDKWLKLCSYCMQDLRKMWKDGREKAWEELPQQFGLPSWGELRKARDDHLTEG